MAVVFHELIPFKIKDKKRLKLFITSLFLKEGRTLENMNIILCTDEYLLNMNRTHLQHDYYTDIITFDLSDTKYDFLNAELYISIDRVRENAATLKITTIKELHRVIFHGSLHLCGFRDKAKKDILVMRAKEEEYLAQYLQ